MESVMTFPRLGFSIEKPGKTLLAFVLVILMFALGCSTAQIISDVQRYEPVIINVLNLACVFSPAVALCTTGEAIFNSTYTLLIGLLTTYEANLKAGTATVAAYNELNAALATFESNSAAILEMGHVFDPNTQKEALTLVASAQTLLAVIEASFPGPPPNPAVSSMSDAVSATAAPRVRRFAAHLPTVTGKFDKHWAHEFFADYNRQVKKAQRETPRANLKTVGASGFWSAIGTGIGEWKFGG